MTRRCFLGSHSQIEPKWHDDSYSLWTIDDIDVILPFGAMPLPDRPKYCSMRDVNPHDFAQYQTDSKRGLCLTVSIYAHWQDDRQTSSYWKLQTVEMGCDCLNVWNMILGFSLNCNLNSCDSDEKSHFCCTPRTRQMVTGDGCGEKAEELCNRCAISACHFFGLRVWTVQTHLHSGRRMAKLNEVAF